MAQRPQMKTFKKSSPCPGCGGYGAGAGCKINQNKLVHCRKTTSNAEVPEGWSWRGLNSLGWGMFAPSDERSTAQVIPFKPRKVEPEAKRLSPVQRSIEYRKLSEQLTLDPASLAWLVNKGLPEASAQRLGFKSYDASTRVAGVSPLLPGIHPADPVRMLPVWKNTGGILIPMRDVDGHVLGFQRVPLGRVQKELSGQPWTKEDGAKYDWLTSSNQHGGIPSLPAPYNHLPLAYFEPTQLNPDYADALILAEGPLKSAIASELAGLRVLAGAGGLFSDNGTPYMQLVETIEAVVPARVILAVDAGMLENNTVSRAYYNTFRALESLDIELQVLWWNQAHKNYGDIDELVLAGRLPDAQAITFDEYFRLQSEEIQKRLDKTRARGFNVRVKRETTVLKADALDVSARREEMRREMVEVVRYGEPGSLHIWLDGCGMGKTTQILDVLTEAKRNKWLKKRQVALTKTTAEAMELKASLGDDAFFMGGRSEDIKSPFFCRENKKFTALAAAGHDATKDFCTECSARLEAMGQPCPFIEAAKQAQKAKIVTSTYGSFLSDSGRLSGFDVIVIDESLHSAGLTVQKILNTETLTAWKQGIMDHCPDKYPRSTHPIWPVFDALQVLLNQCSDLEQHQTLDAGEAFRAVGQSVDLDALYQAEWPEQAKGKEFGFEVLHRKPSSWGYDCDITRLQKRMLVDLLEALTDGTQRADLTRAGIVFERQRASVGILKNKVVINLDGTPALDLLSDMWGGRVQTYGQGGIASNVNITQVNGPIYSPNVMRNNPAQLRDLEALVNRFAGLSNAPLVVGAKGLVKVDDETQKAILNIEHPAATAIWYGNQTRASNAYQHCDSVIFAGCHQPPIADIRRKVNALRTSQPGDNETEKNRVGIATVGDSFSVPGREQHQHADPLVQSVVDNAIYSEVVQAVGRLRPLTRPGQTFNVVYISALVLKGVPVDTIIEGQDILDPHRRKMQRPHLDYSNKLAAMEARMKVEAYLKTNPTASIREIHAHVGGSFSTIHKHAKAVREAFPTVTPMPDSNINTGMPVTPGNRTVSQFQQDTVLPELESWEDGEACIMANDEVIMASIGHEWLGFEAAQRKEGLQLSMGAVIDFNAVVNGFDDNP